MNILRGARGGMGVRSGWESVFCFLCQKKEVGFMTISEAISVVDSHKIGNQYSREEKIKWLSDVDSMIKREIIDTHEGAGGISFSGYNGDTDESVSLLAPDYYSDIYVTYLEAQIDRGNQEFSLYNNDMIMFNSAYQAYAAEYNRVHMPLKRSNIKVSRWFL